MQLTYKVGTIKLERCADMIETDNYKKLLVFPLYRIFVWNLEEKYQDFKIELMQFLFESDSTEFYINEWNKIMFYHKAANVLPLLFLGIKYTDLQKYVDYYEKYYGKFTTKDAALDRINGAIMTINDRIKALNEADELPEGEEPEKFSLWSFISFVELTLKRPISLDSNMARFKRLKNDALKINRDGRKNRVAV